MRDAPIVVFPLYTDGDWFEYPRNGIVSRFWTEEVIYDGPGGAGPAVVHLPEESASAVSFIAPLTTPAAVSEHHCLGLDDLCKVDVCLHG